MWTGQVFRGASYVLVGLSSPLHLMKKHRLLGILRLLEGTSKPIHFPFQSMWERGLPGEAINKFSKFQDKYHRPSLLFLLQSLTRLHH